MVIGPECSVICRQDWYVASEKPDHLAVRLHCSGLFALLCGFLCLVGDAEAPGLGAGAGAGHEASQRQRGVRWITQPLGDDCCPEGQHGGAVHADGGGGGHGPRVWRPAPSANHAGNGRCHH